MVKNIININKMKNQLPPQIIENKTDNHIWRWNSGLGL
jgi:hypothetical protein